MERILLIGNYRPGVGGISGQMELLQLHLRQENHEVEVFSTKGSVWNRLVMYSRLRKVSRGFDILHIHCCSGWGFLPAVLGITVGRKLGKRLVLTYHGGGGEVFFASHTRLVKYFLLRTHVNIVLSGFLGKVFDRYSIPYTTISNIIELDSSHYRERFVISPSFICIRSHDPLYNIPCILRAFQIVQAEVPEASLTLVGEGSRHVQLVQMADQMKLMNVVFTGRVENDRIYTYLNEADIMLSAPMVDNMPVSLLEAMNAGLLVISSRVGGVPYMIEDGHTGLLFESDNSEQLADRMLWAVRHSSAVQEITHSAHQEVEHYRWESVKDKLYAAYGVSS